MIHGDALYPFAYIAEIHILGIDLFEVAARVQNHQLEEIPTSSRKPAAFVGAGNYHLKKKC